MTTPSSSNQSSIEKNLFTTKQNLTVTSLLPATQSSSVENSSSFNKSSADTALFAAKQSVIIPSSLPSNKCSIEKNSLSVETATFSNKPSLKERISLKINKSLKETNLSKRLSRKEDSVETWSEDKVRSWFVENQLSLNIFEKMRPFDGASLKEVFLVKKNLPQFYYESLKDIQDVQLNNIVSFSSCLDKLFR